MNPEKYVVSLELAIKLKEKGYPQENSLFGYYDPSDYENRNRELVIVNCIYAEYLSEYGKASYEFKYAAPISDEILEKLPREISPGFVKYFLICIWEEGVPNIRYKNFDNQLLFGWRPEDKTFDKLSDNIASLWLKLKEGGYL